MQYAGIESHEMFPCQRKSTRVFTALVSVLDWAIAVVWALVLLIDNCGDSRYDAPQQRPLYPHLPVSATTGAQGDV